MSIDRPVTSKYFDNKASMDESLSDFQETKKSFKGPKEVKNPGKAKIKKTKRIKGQKDIRTALKGKKNELVAYAKEFNDVCKKAGVDVDSEQLQLAIALSKSLQNDNNVESDPKTLSSQERIGKIRTTLQEYGFKVPEIKITGKKRTKKLKKHYKLLLTTEAERSQIISDKYSKVLFENLDSSKVNHDANTRFSSAPVYNLATNTIYEFMRDNSVFYVDDLVDKSTSSFSLLRDWAEIPGRPVSPQLFEIDTMKFKTLKCSPEELDVVLSGTLNVTKEIVKKMDKTACPDAWENKTDDDEIVSKCNKVEETAPDKRDENVNNEKNMDFESIAPTTQQHRSSSPDIFDDELSSIMENSKDTNLLSEDHKTKVFSQDNNIMDFTNCAHVLSQNTSKPNSQLSQDVTKRKSNDCMEITNCVATAIQPSGEILENELDLTLSPENENPVKSKPDSIDLTQFIKDNDLTHSSKNETVLETVIVAGKSSEQVIDLTQSYYENNIQSNVVRDECVESMDLTQSSNSTDDLPFVQVGNKSQDDTIILNENEYLGTDGKVRHSVLPTRADDRELFDLTNQENNDSVDKNTSEVKQTENDLGSQSFFDEFVHEHSDNTGNDNLNNSHTDDIDLTQDSDSSENQKDSSTINKTSIIPNNSSLGKRDNISIDYDEIIEDINQNESSSRIAYYRNDDDIFEIINQNNDVVNLSKNSEVFEISDKELDYSINKSRCEIPAGNYDFGGISVMDSVRPDDNLSIDDVDDNKVINKNDTVEDSVLPEVNVKRCNTKVNVMKNPIEEIVTPLRNTADAIQTPNNGLIVKTDEVTPMLDYASMSTPQRNKELDKYGLKPFKRKRAIQILTHLYNQTHPIVEPFSEDQPSPSKKKKTENTNPKSPNKRPLVKDQSGKIPDDRLRDINTEFGYVSPKKKHGNVNKDGAKENFEVYEVTSEVLDIRHIECEPEDWVFQKREKAKLHSCRVPLHIAFHNYVSSRRGLRESILKYEPVNIDVIHKELTSYGHRYDPKDLLKFLDKKCITVKTVDNNSRNKR